MKKGKWIIVTNSVLVSSGEPGGISARSISVQGMDGARFITEHKAVPVK